MISQNEWPEPIMPEDSDGQVKHVDVIDFSKDDFLTDFCMQIGKQMQFPCNTVYMHSLGVIASAMTKSFSYDYYDEECPVSLYVVTAQPPSTGKSGVNKALANPVRIAFGDFNKTQQSKIAKIEASIKAIKVELGASKHEMEIDTLIAELARKHEELEATPVYRYAVTNTTPEALEDYAFSQANTWNIVSDEAGAINVVLGNLYNDGAVNNDIILQSWDGDWLASNRISRKSGDGFVSGSVAVIAQDEAIKSILEAGSRGNGTSERFLLYREGNMLGKRTFKTFNPIEGAMKAKYAHLINKLVFSDKTKFKFTPESISAITDRKEEIEPNMIDGGKYSHDMLRGAVGKMDKQVLKLSCVLHVAENWHKNKPIEIQLCTVKKAIEIHRNLMDMYIVAADSHGYIGQKSELNEIILQFNKFLSKGKGNVKVTALRDNIKNRSIFKGRAKLSAYLKESILPSCEELHLCAIVDNVIYINPKLK